MKADAITANYDLLARVIHGAACGVGSRFKLPLDELDDWEQEGWNALLNLAVPVEDVVNPTALFGVVVRNRMFDWCRKQAKYDAMLKLSYAERSGAEIDENFMLRDVRPQYRDHYTARRSYLEDYFYI